MINRPDSKYVKRMFGVDLTTFYLAHGTPVPPVVNSAIREVSFFFLNSIFLIVRWIEMH